MFKMVNKALRYDEDTHDDVAEKIGLLKHCADWVPEALADDPGKKI